MEALEQVVDYVEVSALVMVRSTKVIEEHIFEKVGS